MTIIVFFVVKVDFWVKKEIHDGQPTKCKSQKSGKNEFVTFFVYERIWPAMCT